MDSAPEPVGRRQLITELGNLFEQNHWTDRDNLALAIARCAGESGILDAHAAAALADSAFLARNHASREELEQALAPLFAGRVPLDPRLDPPPAVTEVHNTTNNNSLTVNGDGNDLSGSFNFGGTQVNITAASSPSELLGAVGALVTDALTSGISESNLHGLASLIESRDDLTTPQLQTAATEAIAAAKPSLGRLAQFRNSLAASVTSGVLVHALILAAEAIPT
jgi:hypothetical protein